MRVHYILFYFISKHFLQKNKAADNRYRYLRLKICVLVTSQGEVSLRVEKSQIINFYTQVDFEKAR